MVFFTLSNEKTFKISSDSCFKSDLKNEKKLDFQSKQQLRGFSEGDFIEGKIMLCQGKFLYRRGETYYIIMKIDIRK